MTADRPLLRVSNLNALLALERLLATRSVRRAADACGVTQSAMSHTLAQLRRELDDPLLVRDGNTMTLTPRAEALAKPLAEALAELDAVLRKPAPFDAASARTRFTIAASDAVAVRVLAPLLQLCSREAPGVEIAVVSYDRATVEDALFSGSIDLAIGPPVAREATKLKQRSLYKSDFIVAVRAANPALKRPWSVDAYCALGHLVVSLGGGPGTAVDAALARLGKSRRIAARVPYFVAAPALVAASDLVLTAPRAAVEPLARGLGLRLLAPPVSLPSTRIAMFFHGRLEASPAHTWLRAALVRVTRE
ncbi:MAG: LysR family transcriptional regulator [Myxococcales bacterium]|nr:LysR family transcriptional regulator [Myxococcales bacterium]